MRDVATLTRGEAVEIEAVDWQGRRAPLISKATFLFYDDRDRKIVVDVNGFEAHVSLDSQGVIVTDRDGRALGLEESDPDLRGEPPQLE